jgi:hypothetical protein
MKLNTKKLIINILKVRIYFGDCYKYILSELKIICFISQSMNIVNILTMISMYFDITFSFFKKNWEKKVVDTS